jgi:ParB-like chromosome segregation protein Spo0J
MKHYQHEIKKVSDLIPYVNNSRTHSDEQATQIASSIKEFGFTNPVLIDESGGLIAGHGRLMAAKKLDLKEVPCIVLSGLTEAQKKAYIIADNQLPQNAGWDLDKLKLEIDTLSEMDFDIDLLGFDDDFLSIMETDVVDLGMTPEEKLDNYLNGDTKIIRLAYSEEEVSTVTKLMDKGLESTGAGDYSTLVFNLVSKESTKW